MKKYNINWRYIAMALGIFIYSTFKYVPIEGEIIFPIILGISFLCGAVYMKKKRKTALEISMVMIMGIIGVLIGAAHYVGGILQNENYQIVTGILIFTLINVVLILRLFDIYINESIQEFRRVRNNGIGAIIIFTTFSGILIYAMVR